MFYVENNGEIYPFKFKITVEYLLCNNGLRQFYFIENTGKVAHVLKSDHRADLSYRVVGDLSGGKQLFGTLDAQVGEIFVRRFADLLTEEAAHMIGAVSVARKAIVKREGGIVKMMNDGMYDLLNTRIDLLMLQT